VLSDGQGHQVKADEEKGHQVSKPSGQKLCPKCGKPMERSSSSVPNRGGGVSTRVVDFCKRCNEMWVDFIDEEVSKKPQRREKRK
jgi:hypothetical protein